jgi:hypothetical protein
MSSHQKAPGSLFLFFLFSFLVILVEGDDLVAKAAGLPFSLPFDIHEDLRVDKVGAWEFN